MAGFVYIWHDRLNSRFYIGSHWGSPADGYVCSSPWMKRAYNRRPNDFKRRILKWVDDRAELLREEERWLQMIGDHEVGKKYYNLTRTAGHWHADSGSLKTIGAKIAASHIRRKERGGTYRSGPVDEETKKKISATLKGRKINYVRSEETRKKISENGRRLHAEGKIGNKGKKASAETRLKMSVAQAGLNNPMAGKKHSEDARAKIAAASRGRIVSAETRRKISEARRRRKETIQ